MTTPERTSSTFRSFEATVDGGLIRVGAGLCASIVLTTILHRSVPDGRRKTRSRARKIREHAFVTAQPNAHPLPPRIQRRALSMAEDAARELPKFPLEALSNSLTIRACGSPEYERAAPRWLERSRTEGSPRLVARRDEQ